MAIIMFCHTRIFEDGLLIMVFLRIRQTGNLLKYYWIYTRKEGRERKEGKREKGKKREKEGKISGSGE